MPAMSRHQENENRSKFTHHQPSANRSHHISKSSSSSSSPSSAPASTPDLPDLPKSTSGLFCLLPWQRLHQLIRLPTLIKASLAMSILVVTLSAFINSQLEDSTTRYGVNAWLCSVAGWVLANTPLCMQREIPETPEAENWHPPSETVWRKIATDRCNIDIVSVSDLSPELFESKYRFKKSVLVTFPNDAADWTNPDDWSKPNLIKSYSDWVTNSGQSITFVRKDRGHTTISSLSDYMNDLPTEESLENDTSSSSEFGCNCQFLRTSGLSTGLRLPPYFQINETSETTFFLMGSSMSGAFFHKGTDSWTGVIHGYKRWFLYPNTYSPPGGVEDGFSIINWVKNVYPYLHEQEKPLECIQYPGEIMYLAEGTYQAVINLGDTIAIASQKKAPTIRTERLECEARSLMDEQIAQHGAQEHPEPKPISSSNRRLLEISVEWHLLRPDAAEPVFRIGLVLTRLEDHAKALYWFAKAIEMDPYFAFAYLHLAMVYDELYKNHQAESMFLKAIDVSPGLWLNYKRYGEFLIKRKRCRDALPVFKKGTELEPENLDLWYYYKHCQEELGYKTRAYDTHKIIMEIKRREEKLRSSWDGVETET